MTTGDMSEQSQTVVRVPWPMLGAVTVLYAGSATLAVFTLGTLYYSLPFLLLAGTWPVLLLVYQSLTPRDAPHPLVVETAGLTGWPMWRLRCQSLGLLLMAVAAFVWPAWLLLRVVGTAVWRLSWIVWGIVLAIAGGVWNTLSPEGQAVAIGTGWFLLFSMVLCVPGLLFGRMLWHWYCHLGKKHANTERTSTSKNS